MSALQNSHVALQHGNLPRPWLAEFSLHLQLPHRNMTALFARFGHQPTPQICYRASRIKPS
jgi:hypothetical protein